MRRTDGVARPPTLPAHGHAHRYAAPGETSCGETSRFRFAHHKLEPYRVAREMADRSQVIAERVPRGYRKWADQLLRSAGSTVGLIGEGANRYSPGQKRHKFTEARGEAGEVAAWVEQPHSCGMVGEADALEVLALADQVCAMLTGLIRRHG